MTGTVKSKHILWCAIIALVVVVGCVTYNVVFYQDWRCAFYRCVRMENVKP